MLFLYALTLFISAAMLFAAELMYTKMVLPLLGGTPAVWNTCTVFFQIVLLAGYTYAHLSASKLKVKSQILIHLIFLLLPLAVLPVALPEGWTPPSGSNPVLWLLMLMTVTIGLPFVVVSTSAPLLQRWFAHTDHPAAKDPYFLYAASNAGSFTGLIGYLVLLEPNFTLTQQNQLWKYGYIALAVLTAVCSIFVLKSKKASKETAQIQGIPDTARQAASEKHAPVTLSRKLRWLVLAFIPSSLMLGLTTHLTTDIASVPLLWVAPLALYLLTFIIAFSRRNYVSRSNLVIMLPIFVLIQTVALAKAPLNLLWLIMVPMPTFFIAALACHRELVEDRPSSEHLTEFYLLMSVGGMLGGMFNALIAPIVFNSIVEYPIVLILACVFCLMPRPDAPAEEKKKAMGIDYIDSVWMIGIAVLTFGTIFIAKRYNFQFNSPAIGLAFFIIALACYATVKKPLRFGAVVGIVILIMEMNFIGDSKLLYQERSFFGVARIKFEPYRQTNQLIHGTTLHGMQSTIPEYRAMPLTYYFLSGPLGQTFSVFSGDAAKKNIAVVGLGTGTLASFANKGQNFTFYEIDRNIKDIALDPKYFTFLRDAENRGAKVDVILGDARLSIADAPDKSYDMIILDAFSSDSVPIHLITRQALQLYLRKLNDHGIIIFHLSNRYLNLKPVFSNLVCNEGLAGIIRNDASITEDEKNMGKVASKWLLVARDMSDFASLAKDPRWEKTVRYPDKPVWSDDYSNILSVLMW